jgi:ABC-type oligopeptide transport system substrate-binding subunit
MQKLWFAALLTIAVAFAQAIGGSEGKSGAGTKKTDTKSGKDRAKLNNQNPKKGGKKSTGGTLVRLNPDVSSGNPPEVQKVSGSGAGKANLNGFNVGNKKGGKKDSKASKQPPAKRPESPK